MPNTATRLAAAALGSLLLTGRAAASSESHGEFQFPETGVTVKGEALLLAIDDKLLPLRDSVCTYLSKPTYRAQPVLGPDKDNPLAPDQVATAFYGGVVHENGKFRMWYYAMRLKVPGDAVRPDNMNLQQGPVCYAESDDGITWKKPNLGQVEIAGSRDNNAILLPDATIEGVHVIKDVDDPDPARRYKMVYNPHDGKTWVIRTATSADGIHWKAAPSFGIDQFLETASLNKFNGYYIVSGQRLVPGESGRPGGREGKAIISPDFDRWIPGHSEAFNLPEPTDPAKCGQFGQYDQVHLGVGAASYGSVVIGLYGIWHNEPGDFSSDKRWAWFGYGKTSCDLGLVISNDGLLFREPVKGAVFMSRFDSPSTQLAGSDYPTILCQSGNGILNVGNETWIYFSRWRNADYKKGFNVEIALARLGRDRWGALGLFPKDAARDVYRERGSVWSAPVRLPAGGCKVVLNVDHPELTSVEVSDGRFALLPGYSGSQRGSVPGPGGLDCAVTWPAGNLEALGGKTVRFKVTLRDGTDASPRLYAVYLR